MTIREAFADVGFKVAEYSKHVFVYEFDGEKELLRTISLDEQVGNWSDCTLVFGPEDLTAEMLAESSTPDELSQSVIAVNEFTLYANTSLKAMCEGYPLHIPMNGTYQQVKAKVDVLLRREHQLPRGQHMCILFLPGGMPWIDNGPDDDKAPLVEWRTMARWKRKLYAVFLSDVPGELGMLDAQVDKICVDNDDIRWALSPMEKLNMNAYENIACLLMYLRRESEGAKLFATLAKLTRFAPLLVNYNRLIYGQPMRLFNIAVLTASLQCLFRGICEPWGNSETAMEHAIDICGYLVGKFGQDLGREALPLYEKEATASEVADVFQRYAADNGLEPDIVMWKKDFDVDTPDEPEIAWQDLRAKDADEIRKTSETQFSHVLQDKRSLARLRAPAFFAHAADTGHGDGAGETRKQLCVFLGKEKQGQNTRVIYFDPHKPELQQLDIGVVDDETGLEQDIGNIGRGFIEQDMVLCVDSSTSMAHNLHGKKKWKDPQEMPRRDIAKAMVKEFLNMCEGFGVIQYVRMLHFSKQCHQIEGLSKLSSVQHIEDALDKAMEELKAGTALYDAIGCAAETLKRDGTGKKRIVVFSDGKDESSQTSKPEALLPILVEANIVLDVVFLSTDDCDYGLMDLVRGTGGAMFLPKQGWNGQECLRRGISFMQQEAFINLDRRRITPSGVSEAERRRFTNELRQYDTDPGKTLRWETCDNVDLQEVQQLQLGMSPIAFAQWIRDCETTKRSVRLWRELSSMHRDENSFLRFIYGQGGVYAERPVYAKYYFRILDEACPYKDKWWCVTAKCQPLYPAMVPVFRFSTIPFHPNVSTEGFVMATLPDVYDPSKSLISQFEAIRDLLIHPDTDRTINTKWAMSTEDERQQLLQESLLQALTDDDIARARPDD